MNAPSDTSDVTKSATPHQRRLALIATLENCKRAVEADKDLIASPGHRHDLSGTIVTIVDRLKLEKPAAPSLTAAERLQLLTDAFDTLAASATALCIPAEELIGRLVPHVANEFAARELVKQDRGLELFGTISNAADLRQALQRRGILLWGVRDQGERLVYLFDARPVLEAPPEDVWRRISNSSGIGLTCGCCRLPLQRNDLASYRQVTVFGGCHTRVHTECLGTWGDMFRIACAYASRPSGAPEARVEAQVCVAPLDPTDDAVEPASPVSTADHQGSDVMVQETAVGSSDDASPRRRRRE